MITVNNGCFLFSKVSVDFLHFRVSAFCQNAYSKTGKPLETFDQLNFQSIKTIYLIWNIFLSMFSVDTF